MKEILVIDDEPGIQNVISLFLRERGYIVTRAGSGEDALAICRDRTFDVILLDYSLPGINGLEALKVLRERDPGLTCIVMTAYGSIRTAVDAIRAGAFDFLTKPFDNDALLLTIEQAIAMRRLTAEVQALRNELAGRYGFSEIVAISPPMREVFRVLDRIAASQDAVLIVGESGTGKELVARAIHRRSRRAVGPFVTVNCAAIPLTLIESEFFGVERGAFTDARESRAGKFELADGGTLFLDEIGDLAIEAQAKLLRVLQDHQVSRLGTGKVLHVDVRIIAATNKDLLEEVKRGRFREDLYYRLDVLNVRLPPLRERSEDLSLLIDHFLEVISTEASVAVPSLSGEARQLLLGYEWPGNVRELENALRRAFALCDGVAIRATDLPLRVRGDVVVPADGAEQKLSLAEATELAIARVERAMIQNALASHKGSKTAAADELGINRKTLFNKIRAYGMFTGPDLESTDDAL